MYRCVVNKRRCGNNKENMQYKKSRQAVKRQIILIADTYHDYILYGIMCCDHIENKR